MKPVYKTSDGKDHDTKKAAEHHEKLLTASAALDTAAKIVARLLGESGVTADGQNFDMLHSRHYWLISECHDMPRLQEVWLWPHQCIVDFDRHTPTIILRYWENDVLDGRYVEVRVNELYADKKKAQAALIEACESRLHEYTVALDQLKQEK